MHKGKTASLGRRYIRCILLPVKFLKLLTLYYLFFAYSPLPPSPLLKKYLAAFEVEFLKKEMLKTSNLGSSLEDSMSGLEDGFLRDLQKHVVVKGRDAGDDRPGLEPRRFHVWPRGQAPY